MDAEFNAKKHQTLQLLHFVRPAVFVRLASLAQPTVQHYRYQIQTVVQAGRNLSKNQDGGRQSFWIWRPLKCFY